MNCCQNTKQKYECLLDEIETLVNQYILNTPTGETRNKLTELNLQILELRNEDALSELKMRIWSVFSKGIVVNNNLIYDEAQRVALDCDGFVIRDLGKKPHYNKNEYVALMSKLKDNTYSFIKMIPIEVTFKREMQIEYENNIYNWNADASAYVLEAK